MPDHKAYLRVKLDRPLRAAIRERIAAGAVSVEEAERLGCLVQRPMKMARLCAQIEVEAANDEAGRALFGIEPDADERGPNFRKYLEWILANWETILKWALIIAPLVLRQNTDAEDCQS